MKEIVKSSLVESVLLKQTLELNLLAGSGLINDVAIHSKRLVKLNTASTFRQQKYNLLREETEGYSRLNVMLVHMPQNSGNVDAFIANVFSVIGHFDLEPNRALDLILDAFEQQPFNFSFIELIRRFRHENVAHILGFKFAHYHPKDNGQQTAAAIDSKSSPRGESSANNIASSASSSSGGLVHGENSEQGAQSQQTTAAAAAAGCTPTALYVLTAVLIMHGIVTLEEILPYLEPSVEVLRSAVDHVHTALKKQIASYGVVSLSGKTGGTGTGGGGSSAGNNADADAQRHLAALQLTVPTKSSLEQTPAAVDAKMLQKAAASGTGTGIGGAGGASSSSSLDARGRPPLPGAAASMHGGRPPPPGYPPPVGAGVDGAAGDSASFSKTFDRITAKVYWCARTHTPLPRCRACIYLILFVAPFVCCFICIIVVAPVPSHATNLHCI